MEKPVAQRKRLCLAQGLEREVGDMSKPQLHWTQISMYTNCGEQYRRRYIEGEKIPPGIALIIGSSTHKSVEHNMKHKFETGELVSLEEVQDVARDATTNRFNEEDVRLSEEEKQKGINLVLAEAVDTTVALAGLHHGTLAPAIEPAKIESAWVMEISGYDYDLAGRIDLKEKNGTVRDVKTTGKAPSVGQADKMDQLTLYALGDWVLEGKTVIPPLAVDFLVKTKIPKAITQTTTRDREDFQTLLARIEAVSLGLERGVFPPTSRDNWLCNPKWCGYFQTCRYVKRG